MLVSRNAIGISLNIRERFWSNVIAKYYPSLDLTNARTRRFYRHFDG